MIALRKIGISRFRSPEAKREFLKYYDVAINFYPAQKKLSILIRLLGLPAYITSERKKMRARPLSF